MCSSRGVAPDFKVLKELVNFQPKASDFTRTLLCTLQKQNLDLLMFVDTVTGGAPSLNDSENVSSL
jgi:hypothetical protein